MFLRACCSIVGVPCFREWRLLCSVPLLGLACDYGYPYNFTLDAEDQTFVAVKTATKTATIPV